MTSKAGRMKSMSPVSFLQTLYLVRGGSRLRRQQASREHVEPHRSPFSRGLDPGMAPSQFGSISWSRAILASVDGCNLIVGDSSSLTK